MAYKIMIGMGVLLGSILVVENYVQPYYAVIIIWGSKAGTLSLVSMIIGAMMGFGIKGMMDKTDYNDDDDFNY